MFGSADSHSHDELSSRPERKRSGEICGLALVRLNGPYQVFDLGHAMADTPALQGFCDTLHCPRISVAGSADLDGGGSREQKFNRVFGGGDAAQTAYRNLDRLCGFVDH